MTPEECKLQLAENLVDSELHALALKDLLDAERQALKSRDTSALGDNAALKKRCVAELGQLDAGRAAIGEACGFGADAAAMRELANWCDQDGRLETSLARFIGIARECSALNAANGAIIRVRQAQINEALCLLRTGTAEADTYGPAGRIAGELGPRTLAEA